MSTTSMDTSDETTKETVKGKSGSKLSLTEKQLRSRELNTANYPVIGSGGKLVYQPRPPEEAGKPYRFKLADAPTGVGIYVGPKGVIYEMAKRGPEGFRRVAIGKVLDLSMEEAFDKARKWAKIIHETGDNPKRIEAQKWKRKSVKHITVGQCMEDYIKRLEGFVKEGKAKAVSAEAIGDSLARLKRAEVDLARKEVRDLTDDDVSEAHELVRLSAQSKSNRIPSDMKGRLEPYKDWAKLTTLELEALGIHGKYIQRVKAAGLAAAEHTLSDAYRAVQFIVEMETEQAQREQRAPDLFANPFKAIRRLKLFREAQELRKHYERAKVRNPLGEDDNSLPTVLKTILARRDEQGGLNKAGADYLLLTLLFGARRGESARLKWYDKCTSGELAQNEASWVWLAQFPDEVNPTTGKRGSQAYFHDTKNGDERFIPIAYFAERILRQRLAERLEKEGQAPRAIRAAEAAYKKVCKETKDEIKQAKALRQLNYAREDLARLVWVFPARSRKANKGHYSDSKSIIRNVRRDSGMLDLDKEIDIGLTPHDLKRTLGRYAEKLERGTIISQMLQHTVPDGKAKVSTRYTQQEWEELRRAFGRVEEAMIATSPRVWNNLKDTDKPRLDEANDPAPTIFMSKKEGLVNAAD
ncbi:site-specific integrase [Stenotrophomonas pigmentata]|uniref:integrase n=1 Tax=Stenotrophomonas pigmentata TaxID=3055080 RepID=UPI0026EA9EA4|nr:integrase [Stenotrophomonas sp. 610A2]